MEKSVVCSRAQETNEHVRLAQLPFATLDSIDFFLRTVHTDVCTADAFYDWILHHPFVVTIIGVVGAGKTKACVGLVLYAIGLRWNKPPDAYRFFYANARTAFDEMARNRYNQESDYDAIIKNTGLLVLDNIDTLEKTERRDEWKQLSTIVMERSDRGKVTVLTGLSMPGIGKLAPEQLNRRIAQGRVLYVA